MDTETKQILTSADHVKSLLNSDGWKIIKEKFDNRVLDLQSIRNIDTTKPDTLNIQLAARMMAVDHMMDWLNKDVIGFVEQQENNNAKVIEEGVESFINRG
jgi:hypothetical protein